MVFLRYFLTFHVKKSDVFALFALFLEFAPPKAPGSTLSSRNLKTFLLESGFPRGIEWLKAAENSKKRHFFHCFFQNSASFIRHPSSSVIRRPSSSPSLLFLAFLLF